MTVREMIDRLRDLAEASASPEEFMGATVVAEIGYQFFDVKREITDLRFTPNGLAVVTLNLRRTDE